MLLQERLSAYNDYCSSILPPIHVGSGTTWYVEKILQTFQEPLSTQRPIPYPLYWTKGQCESADKMKRAAMIVLCCNDTQLNIEQKKGLLSRLFLKEEKEVDGLLKNFPPFVVLQVFSLGDEEEMKAFFETYSVPYRLHDLALSALSFWNSASSPSGVLQVLCQMENIECSWMKDTPFDNERVRKRNLGYLLEIFAKSFRGWSPRALRQDWKPDRALILLGKAKEEWLEKSIMRFKGPKQDLSNNLYTYYGWVYHALKEWNPKSPNKGLLLLGEWLYGGRKMRVQLQNPSEPPVENVFLLLARCKDKSWRGLEYLVHYLHPEEFFSMIAQLDSKEIKDCLNKYLIFSVKNSLVRESLIKTLVWGLQHKGASFVRETCSVWLRSRSLSCEIFSQGPKELVQLLPESFTLPKMKEMTAKEAMKKLKLDRDVFLAQIRMLFREKEGWGEPGKEKETRDLAWSLIGKDPVVIQAIWEGSVASEEGICDFYERLEGLQKREQKKELSHVLRLYPFMNSHHSKKAKKWLLQIPRDLFVTTVVSYTGRSDEFPLEICHFSDRLTPKFFIDLWKSPYFSQKEVKEFTLFIAERLKSSPADLVKFHKRVTNLSVEEMILLLRLLPQDLIQSFLGLDQDDVFSFDFIVELICGIWNQESLFKDLSEPAYRQTVQWILELTKGNTPDHLKLREQLEEHSKIFPILKEIAGGNFRGNQLWERISEVSRILTSEYESLAAREEKGWSPEKDLQFLYQVQWKVVVPPQYVKQAVELYEESYRNELGEMAHLDPLFWMENLHFFGFYLSFLSSDFLEQIFQKSEKKEVERFVELIFQYNPKEIDRILPLLPVDLQRLALEKKRPSSKFPALPGPKVFHKFEHQKLMRKYLYHASLEEFPLGLEELFHLAEDHVYFFFDRTLQRFLKHNEGSPSVIDQEPHFSEAYGWRQIVAIFLLCKDSSISRREKQQVLSELFSEEKREESCVELIDLSQLPSVAALAILEVLSEEKREQQIALFEKNEHERGILKDWIACGLLKANLTEAPSEALLTLLERQNLLRPQLKKQLQSEEERAEAYKDILFLFLKKEESKTSFVRELHFEPQAKVALHFLGLLSPKLRNQILSCLSSGFYFTSLNISESLHGRALVRWTRAALENFEAGKQPDEVLISLANRLWDPSGRESFCWSKWKKGSAKKNVKEQIFTSIMGGFDGSWKILPHAFLEISKEEFFLFVHICSANQRRQLFKQFISSCWSSSGKKIYAEWIEYALQKIEDCQCYSTEDSEEWFKNAKVWEDLSKEMIQAFGSFSKVKEHFFWGTSKKIKEQFFRLAPSHFKKEEQRALNLGQRWLEGFSCFSNGSLLFEEADMQSKSWRIAFSQETSDEKYKRAQRFLITKKPIEAWEASLSLDLSGGVFFDLLEDFLLNPQQFDREKIKKRAHFFSEIFLFWPELERVNPTRASKLLSLFDKKFLRDLLNEIFYKDNQSQEFIFDVIYRNLIPQSLLPKSPEKQCESYEFKVFQLGVKAIQKRNEWDRFLKKLSVLDVKKVALFLRMASFGVQKNAIRFLYWNWKGQGVAVEAIRGLVEQVVIHPPLPQETFVSALPIVNTVIQVIREEDPLGFFQLIEPALWKSSTIKDCLRSLIESEDPWKAIEKVAIQFISLRKRAVNADKKVYANLGEDIFFETDKENNSLGTDLGIPTLNKLTLLVELGEAKKISSLIREEELKKNIKSYESKIRREEDIWKEKDYLQMWFKAPSLFTVYHRYIGIDFLLKLFNTPEKEKIQISWILYLIDEGEMDKVNFLGNFLSEKKAFSLICLLKNENKEGLKQITKASARFYELEKRVARQMNYSLSVDLTDPHLEIQAPPFSIETLFRQEAFKKRKLSPSNIALLFLSVKRSSELSTLIQRLEKRGVTHFQIAQGALEVLRAPDDALLILGSKKNKGAGKKQLMNNIGSFDSAPPKPWKQELVKMLSLKDWIRIYCHGYNPTISKRFYKLFFHGGSSGIQERNEALLSVFQEEKMAFIEWLSICINTRFFGRIIDTFLPLLSEKEMLFLLSKSGRDLFNAIMEVISGNPTLEEKMLNALALTSEGTKNPRKLWYKVIHSCWHQERRRAIVLEKWISSADSERKKYLDQLYPNLSNNQPVDCIKILSQTRFLKVQDLLFFASKTNQDPVEVLQLAYTQLKFRVASRRVPELFWEMLLKNKDLSSEVLIQMMFLGTSLGSAPFDLGESIFSVSSQLQGRILLKISWGFCSKESSFYPRWGIAKRFFRHQFSSEKGALWGDLFKKCSASECAQLALFWGSMNEDARVLKDFTEGWTKQEKKKLFLSTLSCEMDSLLEGKKSKLNLLWRNWVPSWMSEEERNSFKKELSPKEQKALLWIDQRSEEDFQELAQGAVTKESRKEVWGKWAYLEGDPKKEKKVAKEFQKWTKKGHVPWRILTLDRLERLMNIDPELVDEIFVRWIHEVQVSKVSENELGAFFEGLSEELYQRLVLRFNKEDVNVNFFVKGLNLKFVSSERWFDFIRKTAKDPIATFAEMLIFFYTKKRDNDCGQDFLLKLPYRLSKKEQKAVKAWIEKQESKEGKACLFLLSFT